MKIPMQCICREEGKTECEANLNEAIALLAKEYQTCTKDEFLDLVIVELSDRYELTIYFGVDMWYGVFASSEKLQFRTMVPCDRPIHGLAALYLYCHKNLPKRS